MIAKTTFFKLKTPVVFIIFNRPETTERVFEEIRKARPLKLFVVADGHRADCPGEEEKCAEVRAIIDRVDWDCEVIKNYSTKNLGCGARPATGISWVFEQVEEAIILEDDCLPHPSFFQFCQELLEHYRDDDRIMQISGDNFQFGEGRSDYSYYFSMFSHPVSIWGWATWRRAWEKYDHNIKLWPEIRAGGWLKTYLGNNRVSAYWTMIFDEIYNRQYTSCWDYQWTFCRWIQEGLCIVPNQNLISNIGWGNDATHTTLSGSISIWDNIPSKEMKFPLKHPPYVLRDRKADEANLKMNWANLPVRIVRLIMRVIHLGKKTISLSTK